MTLKYLLSTLILLFNLVLLSAQPEELNGLWEGTLSQDEGGYAPLYKFSLYLEVRENYVNGRSFVSVLSGDINNEMEVMALWRKGDILFFRENRVLKSNKPDLLEWCYKSGELRLIRTLDGEWRLEGPWWGESLVGTCVPGFIRLKKAVPKA